MKSNRKKKKTKGVDSDQTEQTVSLIKMIVNNYIRRRTEHKREMSREGETIAGNTLELLRIIFLLTDQLDLRQQFEKKFKNLLKKHIAYSSKTFSYQLRPAIVQYSYKLCNGEDGACHVTFLNSEDDYATIHGKNLYNMIEKCERVILDLVHKHIKSNSAGVICQCELDVKKIAEFQSSFKSTQDGNGSNGISLSLDNDNKTDNQKHPQETTADPGPTTSKEQNTFEPETTSECGIDSEDTKPTGQTTNSSDVRIKPGEPSTSSSETTLDDSGYMPSLDVTKDSNETSNEDSSETSSELTKDYNKLEEDLKNAEEEYTEYSEKNKKELNGELAEQSFKCLLLYKNKNKNVEHKVFKEKQEALKWAYAQKSLLDLSSGIRITEGKIQHTDLKEIRIELINPDGDVELECGQQKGLFDTGAVHASFPWNPVTLKPLILGLLNINGELTPAVFAKIKIDGKMQDPIFEIEIEKDTDWCAIGTEQMKEMDEPTVIGIMQKTANKVLEIKRW